MRTLIWYEAVQVVSRHPDGALAEWYPADNEERRAQRFSAIEDRDMALRFGNRRSRLCGAGQWQRTTWTAHRRS